MEPEMVVIIIRNSTGQFFVHQRGPNKEMFPLRYGLGAGGHIEPEETPEDAAKRELGEETGIEGESSFLFEVDFKSPEVSHVIHVFEVSWDRGISPCEEWIWGGWLTEKEVDRLADADELCPDTMIIYRKYTATK